MKKIEIRRWDVLDIYFKSEDYDSVNKLIDEYKLKGWSVEGEDSAGVAGYDICIQLMKWYKRKNKKL